MLQKPKTKIIALEEHYLDKELMTHVQVVERNPKIAERLYGKMRNRTRELDRR